MFVPGNTKGMRHFKPVFFHQGLVAHYFSRAAISANGAAFEQNYTAAGFNYKL